MPQTLAQQTQSCEEVQPVGVGRMSVSVRRLRLCGLWSSQFRLYSQCELTEDRLVPREIFFSGTGVEDAEGAYSCALRAFDRKARPETYSRTFCDVREVAEAGVSERVRDDQRTSLRKRRVSE